MRQGGMAASQYLRDLLQNERGPEVLNAMMDRVRAVRPWMHYGCNNPVGEQPRFGLAASALLAQIHFHPHLRVTTIFLSGKGFFAVSTCSIV